MRKLKALVLISLMSVVSVAAQAEDNIAVIDIQKIIKQLASNGIGILITDHSVRETLGICDQAYIVNQGEIFAQGTPKVIAQNQNVKDIYLGENFIL